VEVVDENRELHTRLVRELARRLYWFGLTYGVFAGLYAFRPGMGGRVAWSLHWLCSSSVAFRSWCAKAVLQCPSTKAVQHPGTRLIAIAAIQGVFLFAYLSQAIWRSQRLHW
jgi:hypothetical protein